MVPAYLSYFYGKEVCGKHRTEVNMFSLWFGHDDQALSCGDKRVISSISISFTHFLSLSQITLWLSHSPLPQLCCLLAFSLTYSLYFLSPTHSILPYYEGSLVCFTRRGGRVFIVQGSTSMLAITGEWFDHWRKNSNNAKELVDRKVSGSSCNSRTKRMIEDVAKSFTWEYSVID